MMGNIKRYGLLPHITDRLQPWQKTVEPLKKLSGFFYGISTSPLPLLAGGYGFFYLPPAPPGRGIWVFLPPPYPLLLGGGNKVLFLLK